MAEMSRILFVDDEPRVLEGLQRMLRPMRRQWDMVFVDSGAAALDVMDQDPVDVVVTDMRMPAMDGVALLREVMQRYPDTARFVLSGQSDRESVLRSVGPIHQFLSKPCDPDLLKATVERALALRRLLRNDALVNQVMQMPSLPTLPDTYAKLVDELESPDASAGSVGRIIEADVGLFVKILQWVNSAYFGLRHEVSNATQAVSLLGLDTVKSLVLATGVFNQIDTAKLPPHFSLDRMWKHSMAVATAAQAIARAEQADAKVVSDTFAAGLLHDAGRLVFASNCPGAYEKMILLAGQKRVPLMAVEERVFACTHAAMGAYLLGLWGLPDPIVEAVAFHHAPSASPAQHFAPLTAVHVANALQPDSGGTPLRSAQSIDQDHLAAVQLAGRLPEWEALCEAVVETGEKVG